MRRSSVESGSRVLTTSGRFGAHEVDIFALGSFSTRGLFRVYKNPLAQGPLLGVPARCTRSCRRCYADLVSPGSIRPLGEYGVYLVA